MWAKCVYEYMQSGEKYARIYFVNLICEPYQRIKKSAERYKTFGRCETNK